MQSAAVDGSIAFGRGASAKARVSAGGAPSCIPAPICRPCAAVRAAGTATGTAEIAYPIYASKILKKDQRCPLCTGRGRTICKVCSGAGRMVGDKEVKCEWCDGRGTEKCGRCGGEGYVFPEGT
mmetsp:Transcript_15939/g.50076  ORF Transcript_15939/g.50076 Transcript_15939/m.50076 type:complete len:124 (+) Transcript_15939:117-488(+)|eukprot:CAMPEP_0182892902 /NCGR_PEP_ID=MMETSP0034_2-20130328/24154_1 /TAXON_ID=156128 /ORGANISM="Nephroselmis pyriformis, Strain CCMP717" /LENGTH=123 /DNA_ID=CAMNT_0025026617 /DNA_START=89 /DNA_END=460 /DNA_ORIENTATION=+